MHISKKLRAAEEAGRPTYSFEFFPPKTEQVSDDQTQMSTNFGANVSQGVQNLYDRTL